jgi:hypothetical protein
MRALRVRSERLGEVAEIVSYLQNMEAAYNHIFAFDLIVQEAKERYGEETFRWGRSRRRASRTIRQIRDPGSVVLPENRLRLRAVSIQSPGSWDFLGALNPLETLRKYLADRHERKKDVAYRNAAEAERLRLENEKLKTEVVRDRIEILRDLDVPEDRIAAALNLHIVAPLSKLDEPQDTALILDAEIVEVEDGDKQQPGETPNPVAPADA